MKYVCETCNKVFSTHEEAEVCEKAHEREREAESVMEAEAEEISKAVSAFVVKYKRKPGIVLTDEASAVLFDNSTNRIADLLWELLW